MPTSEINITIDTRNFVDYNMIAGAYRVALERHQGLIGIFHLNSSQYDEYDAAAASIGLALEELYKSLADNNVVSYNITFHSEYGQGLWTTLLDKKPDAYEKLFRKLTTNPNVIVRLGLTQPGNNPLRNHTYIAAIEALTDIKLPATLAESHPHQWFTMQRVFTECYGPLTNLGTPATENLKNNLLEFERIRSETPDVYNVLNRAISHLESRLEVSTTA